MSRKKVSTRVERRREKTKSEILKKSSLLFSQMGFDDVCFEDIANAADVARGTLYSFFKNKEALIDELISNIHKKLIQGTESIKRMEPSSRIDALLNLYLDLWESNPDALMIFDQTQKKIKSAQAKYYKQLKTKIEDIFTSIEGSLRSKDSNLSMELFSSTSIPSLKTFSSRKNFRTLFKEHFRATLLNPVAIS